MALNIAFNYGGRAEVIDGTVRMARRCARAASREELNEDSFHRFLYGPEVPDPDILIRTAGEMRISNFLLYQTAYTELYFTETLWPDFRAGNLAEAVIYFQGRARRMGNV